MKSTNKGLFIALGIIGLWGLSLSILLTLDVNPRPPCSGAFGHALSDVSLHGSVYHGARCDALDPFARHIHASIM